MSTSKCEPEWKSGQTFITFIAATEVATFRERLAKEVAHTQENLTQHIAS